ncbi:MAG: hypothetical protein KIS78_04590 [Labilithrix sp.]|nr:hypothetical protein [Labilithrix sp.]MCW5831717.1 hypothetical protein [Labilithrix sp.]
MNNTEALKLAQAYIQANEPCDLSWESDPACAFWFNGNPEADEHFHVFATRGDGSLLALWKKSGAALDSCPVVLLGGEGELAVLGDDVARALALMATIGSVDFQVFVNAGAKDDEGAVDEPSDAGEDKVLEPDDAFAEWTKTTLGVERPRRVAKTLIAAMKRHEGLVKLARGLVKR